MRFLLSCGGFGVVVALMMISPILLPVLIAIGVIGLVAFILDIVKPVNGRRYR